MIIEFIEEGRKDEWEYTGINLEKIEMMEVRKGEGNNYRVRIITERGKELVVTLDKEKLFGLETVIEKFYGRVGIGVKKIEGGDRNG